MSDMANQHETATGQAQALPAGRAVHAILVQRARHRALALGKGGGEIALHQPKPIAVDGHFFFRVDSGDGIFAVLDRGKRRFEQHVGDAGRIRLADGVIPVDADLNV
jgi:hypothetical protein